MFRRLRTRRYWFDLATGLAIGLSVSWLTYLWGLDRGEEDGMRQGRLEAYSAALGNAKKLAQETSNAVSDVFIQKMIEERYGQELNKREADGYNRCVADGYTGDDLKRHYAIFKDKIRRARATRTPKELFEAAESIIETKRLATESISIITDGVLNGVVDELALALKKKDQTEVDRIVRKLEGTLPDRDINLERAIRKLQEAK